MLEAMCCGMHVLLSSYTLSEKNKELKRRINVVNNITNSVQLGTKIISLVEKSNRRNKANITYAKQFDAKIQLAKIEKYYHKLLQS